MTNVSTQDRRRSTRYQGSLEVEFCANDGTYRGVSNSSSVSGLFIETDNCLSPKSIVFMKVHLPDGSISTLKGRVRRIQKMSHSMFEASERACKDGIAIEIIERDANYIKFFMALLRGIHNRKPSNGSR